MLRKVILESIGPIKVIFHLNREKILATSQGM
jgi:hypothetical protein